MKSHIVINGIPTTNDKQNHDEYPHLSNFHADCFVSFFFINLLDFVVDCRSEFDRVLISD